MCIFTKQTFSEGFYCNESFPGGGEDITCPEGQRVDVDMTQLTWSCVEVDGDDLKGFVLYAKHFYSFLTHYISH